MSTTKAVLYALIAWLAVAPAAAETLLVVRKTDDALDFIDPGSGLRLASVALGHAPHEVSVSPDGKRAAVTNYGTREQPGSTLSIVDLEQPQEVRRIDLTPHTRPHGVAWFAPDRIAVTTEGTKHLVIVDPDAGRVVGAIETGQDVSHMVAVSADAKRAYVTNIGSDRHQFRRMAQQAREALGTSELTALADRGYYGGPEIKACTDAGITPLVPKIVTSQHHAAGRFDKSDFSYDAKTDTFRCPAGERAIRRFTTPRTA